jgi:hypothetical protein
MARLARRLAFPFALLALLAAPAASSAADYTWSGVAEHEPFSNWSNPENWLGGVPPSGSVGTLSFPFVGFKPRNQSENDLAGISANAMDITGGFPGHSVLPESSIYEIEGNQIGLGEGGITVTPSVLATSWTETDIMAPLLLSAPQTWTVNGNANGTGYLHIDGDVSGPSQALSVALNTGNLTVGGDVETAAISLSGTGSVGLGSAVGNYLVGALNGNNGNPVNLGSGVSLFDQNTTRFDQHPYDLGALTLAEGALLKLGQAEYSAPVPLPVNGGITLSPNSQLSLLYNSQITATGAVNLNGASLRIEVGTTLINGAPACNVLDVDTLVSTTATITGTFQGVPDGGLISLPCGLPVDALARVNYTPHAVIATLLQRTTTALQVSDTTPPAGRPVTATATVTGERVGEGNPAGTVSFFDGGAPIPGCSAQPLLPNEAVSSASCELSFPAAGTHEITAAYSGSPTFLASTSSTPRVIVVGPAAPGPRQGAGHRLLLLSKRIRVRASGAASLRLDCRGEASCRGTLRLTVKHDKGTMRIASARFSILTGRHTVALKLNRAGKRLLARAGGRLEATLIIGGDGGGKQRRVHLILTGRRAGR